MMKEVECMECKAMPLILIFTISGQYANFANSIKCNGCYEQ